MDSISICEALAKRNKIDSFLKRMVTGDEKWVPYDNIVRKRSWSKRGEAAQTVAKPGLTSMKVLLCTCLNVVGYLKSKRGLGLFSGVTENIRASLQSQVLGPKPDVGEDSKTMTFGPLEPSSEGVLYATESNMAWKSERRSWQPRCYWIVIGSCYRVMIFLFYVLCV
ncbi:mariner transposase [Trichonephila clavipes]|nr:mariner transposase [Trichonephila clavipes]